MIRAAANVLPLEVDVGEDAVVAGGGGDDVVRGGDDVPDGLRPLQEAGGGGGAEGGVLAPGVVGAEPLADLRRGHVADFVDDGGGKLFAALKAT